MKRENTTFFFLLIAIVTNDDGPPPPPDDDANSSVADTDTLARMRELLRPVFPMQYALN
jgi:hypothetical protein